MEYQTLATRVSRTALDYAISSTLLADFRFGWFQYKVDVLPGDFGTTPAADAGIPNLNKDTNFTSGLPYFGIRGNQADMDWGWSLNDNAGRCNCPLNENEKQWQTRRQRHETVGQSHLESRRGHSSGVQPARTV